MMSREKGNEMGTHENVMLLAMSTLPREPKFNTYLSEEENGERVLYFKSLSQMEPHTKYVLWLLAKKNERLDRIVILASSEARNDRPEGLWHQETAVSLYQKRISHYLNGPEQVDIQAEDELEQYEESAGNFQMYQGRLPEFIIVEQEKPLFFWVTVKVIRSREQGKAVHLYMDMQGGDRNSVARMNAIAELLERQNVMIKGRFANDFDPKRKTPLHTIREASREYKTYDLISAMDIFAQYGWGDKLEQYFRGITEKDSKERRLIEAIKLASSSISRCDGEGFDDAVRKIEELRPEFGDENPGTVTEMDVVFHDIEENYAPLFDARYRYVEQIRWCLDKNFLQQALTIFEAKMPYEFIHSGLMYYMVADQGKEERTRFLEYFERKYNEIKTNTLQTKPFQLRDLNHYLIKYGYSYEPEIKKLFSFGLQGALKKKTLNLLYEYRGLCEYRNKVNHASMGKHNPDGFFCYMKTRYKNDPNWEDSKEEDYKKKLLKYLDKWQALADQVPDKIRAQIVDLS